jgi:hypothetical protein
MRTTRLVQLVGLVVAIGAFQSIRAVAQTQPGGDDGPDESEVCEPASKYCVGKESKFVANGKKCKSLYYGSDCTTCVNAGANDECDVPGGGIRKGQENDPE